MSKITYAVEAWTIPGDEEPCEEEMIHSHEFDNLEDAKHHAWDRLEEGYAVRMYRR